MPKANMRRNPAKPVQPVTIKQLKRRHRTALEAQKRAHAGLQQGVQQLAAAFDAALEQFGPARILNRPRDWSEDLNCMAKEIASQLRNGASARRERDEAQLALEGARAAVSKLEADVDLVTKERDGADVERARAEQAFREAHKEIERLHTELRALKRAPTPHTEGRRDVYTKAVGA